MNWNKEFAKVREGEQRDKSGKHELYDCPAGKITIGWGHNIEDNGLSDRAAELILTEDLQAAQKEVVANFDGWDNCNFVRKSVLIDMCFNMGWGRLSAFKRMFKAIDDSDWTQAAAEMKDSNWYNQVGLRAKVLEKMMLTGEYQE